MRLLLYDVSLDFDHFLPAHLFDGSLNITFAKLYSAAMFPVLQMPRLPLAHRGRLQTSILAPIERFMAGFVHWKVLKTFSIVTL